MSDLIKVEGDPDLRREKNSGAIVNASLEKFMAHKKSKNGINNLRKRMDNLEEKLDVIISLLNK